MSRTVKCNRCNVWRQPTDFISNERNVKCCLKCRVVAIAQNKKYREVHAEQISKKTKKYRDDHAEEMCEWRKVYREIHAVQISKKRKEHYEKLKKTYPLNMKFKHMIHTSIQSDTKKNRLYDPVDYIDEPYLNYLWSDQDQHCFHCNCEMTLEFSPITRIPTQISVQRLKNDLAHIKSNCVLSCLSCNVNRKELEI
jgi:DNA polymerase III delta prime subunit